MYPLNLIPVDGELDAARAVLLPVLEGIALGLAAGATLLLLMNGIEQWLSGRADDLSATARPTVVNHRCPSNDVQPRPTNARMVRSRQRRIHWAGQQSKRKRNRSVDVSVGKRPNGSTRE